ncbi:fibronectin type III domain-containing protein [uncultured Algibacter sp.]|uniref:fibronectin type III domain-containing protein n=1 Tax=uncultured Algibacter sp. TaxID=298659 RepID=UPI0026254BDA|nr:fibronectin type III domain-containing protein [uncultured Algibacter sp.]
MKKTYLYLAVCLGFVVSCSSGGGDDDPTPAENKAPSTPSQVYPLNNTLCIDNAVIFEWNASTDPEGNSISYKIEISENSSFTALAFNETSTTNSRLISIQKGKAFYWRVKAVDSEQAESGYSSVSQFLTEGEGISNHLPFSPDLVSPTLNAEIDGTSTTLSWTASDVDNDALTYDVYLDTTSNPTTKVSENQTETNFTASSLTAASNYYFKVVVKDENGGTTIGQIWSFKTK